MMIEEILRKISNPLVRKEIRKIDNNGHDFDVRNISSFLVDSMEADMVQTFKDIEPTEMMNHLEMGDEESERIFILFKADHDFYCKATEFVEQVSEKLDTDVKWKFLPEPEQGELVKVISMSD